MRHNRKLIITAIIFNCIFTGCDQQIDALHRLNKSTNIEYYTLSKARWEEAMNSAVIIDTGKVSSEMALGRVYSASIRLKNKNGNYVSALIENLSEGQLYINSMLIDQIDLNEDSVNLTYGSKNAGVHKFRIRAWDSFSEESSFEFSLLLRANISPVAKLDISRISQVHHNEFQLDASGSYDRDDRYGGDIISYQFLINDVVINSQRKIIKHIFKAGDTVVRVRVQDNDGEYSDFVEKKLTVQ